MAFDREGTLKKAEKLLDIPNLYDDLEGEWVHHITQALRAHYLYKRDVEYVVKAGEECAVVESVKAASDLYMPVSGTIAAVNEALQTDPALINKEPYGGGWMIKVQPADLAGMDALMSASDYAKAIGEA